MAFILPPCSFGWTMDCRYAPYSFQYTPSILRTPLPVYSSSLVQALCCIHNARLLLMGEKQYMTQTRSYLSSYDTHLLPQRSSFIFTVTLHTYHASIKECLLIASCIGLIVAVESDGLLVLLLDTTWSPIFPSKPGCSWIHLSVTTSATCSSSLLHCVGSSTIAALSGVNLLAPISSSKAGSENLMIVVRTTTRLSQEMDSSSTQAVQGSASR